MPNRQTPFIRLTRQLGTAYQAKRAQELVMGDKVTVVVVGDEGVGKSALTLRFCLSHFPEGHEPTVDDTIRKPAEIDGQPYNINIIDTAGREKYATLTEHWIGQGETFIMVYNVASRESFLHVQHYYEQIRATQPNFGAHSSKPEAIASTTSHFVPLVLVGNKSDLQDQRAISTDQGVHLARKLGCKYIETSAKKDVNVEEAFSEAVRTNRRQQEAVGHRLFNEVDRDPACRRHKCTVL